jgi:Flp pilus assembly pilin Flp
MLQQGLYSVARRDTPPAAESLRQNFGGITQMKTLVQQFKQLHNDEAGQGLVEYIMLIALVIAAAAACFPGLSTALKDAFVAIGAKLALYVA